MTERNRELIRTMPKAENHIHIEGSIPWELAIRLAKKNKVELPSFTLEGLKAWTGKTMREKGLDGFMICDRAINSVCRRPEDYEETILELARLSAEQNIIYQEYHLDYPLNQERGIPMEVVMEGYREGQKKAIELYGVDIVYFGGLDRTLSEERCLNFVKALESYQDMVVGVGMDCEEKGHPCVKHLKSYKRAKEMGMFLTAHAGEDGPEQNIWDALKELKVDRIDHGTRAARDPALMEYLKERDILLAMCVTSNVMTGATPSYEQHDFKILLQNGVPVSFSSDDPPYLGNLNDELEVLFDRIGLSEEKVIELARNAFAYSVSGRKYLPKFDKWKEDFLC